MSLWRAFLVLFNAEIVANVSNRSGSCHGGFPNKSGPVTRQKKTARVWAWRFSSNSVSCLCVPIDSFRQGAKKAVVKVKRETLHGQGAVLAGVNRGTFGQRTFGAKDIQQKPNSHIAAATSQRRATL